MKIESGKFDPSDLVPVYALPNLRSVMPGNKVMLRSGGPEMTVSDVDAAGNAICSWLNSDGVLEHRSFQLECLTCYGAK